MKPVTFFLLLAFVSLAALYDWMNTVDFTVTNHQPTVLSKLLITAGRDTLTVTDLDPGRSFSGTLNFRNAIQIDGQYELLFNGQRNRGNFYGFGYYSNGTPLDEKFDILVETDTIRITNYIGSKQFTGRIPRTKPEE